MACCGQSRPTQPVTPPKFYGTRNLNPQAGTVGSPAFSQRLSSQPAAPVVAPPKVTRTKV